VMTAKFARMSYFVALGASDAMVGAKCGDEVPQTCYVYFSCSRYCLFVMKHTDSRSFFGQCLPTFQGSVES
jgi:hypothetical protein